MKNKPIDKFSFKEVICLLVIVAFVSLMTGFVVSYRVLKDTSSNNQIEIDGELETFIDNYNYIINNYYGDIDKDKLMTAALEGMLNSLGDPYTAYIDETEVNNFNIQLEKS